MEDYKSIEHKVGRNNGNKSPIGVTKRDDMGVLTWLRENQYEGSWVKMYDDLRGRLEENPTYNLRIRIEGDLDIIKKLMKKEHITDLLKG